MFCLTLKMIFLNKVSTLYVLEPISLQLTMPARITFAIKIKTFRRHVKTIYVPKARKMLWDRYSSFIWMEDYRVLSTPKIKIRKQGPTKYI
jgi:hypothetical protein